VEQLGASKPVIHMAQTKTIRRGLLASLNFTSSPRFYEGEALAVGFNR
jgi:hypothetical protein